MDACVMGPVLPGVNPKGFGIRHQASKAAVPNGGGSAPAADDGQHTLEGRGGGMPGTSTESLKLQ
jgi:hypothetical protein